MNAMKNRFNYYYSQFVVNFSGDKLLALTWFAIAMGLLEAAVVVYLRKLLYSQGFDFPVQPIEDSTIALTEILREAATLVMLLTIGYIYGRNLMTRFAAFLFSFAVWDIFYYVFLKVLIGWPDSLLTWDVLFLIPVTWVGPVIAPVLVSFTMIVYALVFFRIDKVRDKATATRFEWKTFILGALIIILSFTIEPLRHMLQHARLSETFNINGDELMKLMINYIPEHFNWWIFAVGEIVLLLGIGLYYQRNKLRLEELKAR